MKGSSWVLFTGLLINLALLFTGLALVGIGIGVGMMMTGVYCYFKVQEDKIENK